MSTSASKTRALCVATRCTSVDQFVATFHRFCGDDQTFFVATMTSRPVGLETAFSIQLADKQPVLRGLCVVLDAWATPENRYKRPGIRLGIKRLTPDSQLVFDRLRAAAKAPGAVAEATPPPGPPPGPPIPSSAPALRPPAFALRATGSPPALPRLNMPPASLPPVRAKTETANPPPVYAAPAPPVLPPVPPAAAPPVPRAPVLPASALLVPRPPVAVPPIVEPMPPAVAARAPEPPSAAKLPATPPPSDGPDDAKLDASDAEPGVSTEPGGSEDSSALADPSPVAVTRFQVALKVGTIPPPISGVEFKPTPLVSRPRAESRIVSDPAPDETPVDPTGEAPRPAGNAVGVPTPFDSASLVEPGSPALIGDRPNKPSARPVGDPMPSRGAADPAARAPDPEPAADLRTPGSAIVLPANPLQDLSDASLEGFVDCTLYEEAMSVFPPDGDGGEEEDAVAEPPPPQATRATPATNLPAMPFETPPNLTVRALGNTESLTVAADEPPPAAEPPAAPAFALTSTAALFAPLHHGRPASANPWPEAVSATYGQSFPGEASHSEPGFSPGDTAAAMTVQGHVNAGQRLAAYSNVDATSYAHYPSSHLAQPVAPPEMLPEPALEMAPAWQRRLAICGTAAVAVVIAFVVARLVRGSNREEPAVIAISAGGATSRAAPAPAVVPGGSAGSGSDASRAAGHDRKVIVAAEPAGSAEPAGGPEPGSADPPPDPGSPDDDGEAASGGTPIVGSGPCRFSVATTPAGSTIRLDDQPMGPSPITIEGTCDKHKIDASHARYQSVTRWVTLTADKPQQLDISLPRPVHAVTVTSFPSGAELSIDGHRAGTTPTVVQMMGFATVHLTFTKPGFQTVTKKVYSKLPQDRVFVKLLK